MNIKAGDQVAVLRTIYRKEGLYAKKGDTGQVLETTSVIDHESYPRRWHAKVLMDGVCKTLRITSLEKVISDKDRPRERPAHRPRREGRRKRLQRSDPPGTP